MTIRHAAKMLLSLGAVIASVIGLPRPASAQPSPFLVPNWTDLNWRTDYNVARKESAEKGLPILIDFGTEHCYYCRKLETTTFRDPRVSHLMSSRFVLLKVDADREPFLANKLDVMSYPTLVFADSTGKIIHRVEGYKDASAFHDIVQASLARIPAPEAVERQYQLAVQHTQQRNYAAAIPMFRAVAADARAPQLQPQAQKYLELIEQQAADRIAAARDLESKGRVQDAIDTVEDAARTYPGVEATKTAAMTVSRLKDSSADRAGAARVVRARELLAQARDFHKQNELVLVVDRCAILSRDFADLPEAQEANLMLGALKNNPVQLQQAADALGERLGEMYMAVAESHLKSGQPQRAEFCFQRVLQTCPGSRQAEAAQVRLAQIQSIMPRSGAPGSGNGLTSATEK